MKRAGTIVAIVIASAIGGWVGQALTGSASAAGFQPAGYTPLGQPTRLLDTRTGTIAEANQQLTVRVGSGAFGAVAAGVNIALTETTGPGFVTVWDCNGTRPPTSVVNSSGAGENVSNFVIVPLNASGSFCLFTNSATHIVVDLMGLFAAA